MLFSATKQTSPSGKDTSDDEYLAETADELSMVDKFTALGTCRYFSPKICAATPAHEQAEVTVSQRCAEYVLAEDDDVPLRNLQLDVLADGQHLTDESICHALAAADRHDEPAGCSLLYTTGCVSGHCQ